MDQEQQSRWRLTRRRVMWFVGIVATALVLGYIGYLIPRTGFGQTAVKEGVQPAKTLWDWMDLLIVPAVLAVGGYLFTRSENRATQAAAERRAQEEALQAYLNQMSDMLIPNNDQPSLSDEHPLDSLKTVARARTLTVLPRLAGDGKARVVQFLYESGLITRDTGTVELNGADLRGVILYGANLSGANLRGVNLSEANLSGANLDGNNLSEAILDGADLSGATLSWPAAITGITNEELEQQVSSLKGATMTNGHYYEYWLKSRGGENIGP